MLPLIASLGISGAVYLAVLVLWHAGYLQRLELSAYDSLIRLQPTAAVSHPRIVVITMTEKDINDLGRWPISDAALANVLERLAKYKPRAIGLDIYRDIPVPPGREQLDEVLMRHSNIIATMKFGGAEEQGIPAPPVLRDAERVGFNDILIDFDGVVRRGLLFLDDGTTTGYSFALRLALLYLPAQGIMLRPAASDPEHIQLGSATIPPLKTDDGGYVDLDARGYQFLLDFHDLPQQFPNFSLSALMSGKIDSSLISDNVVIIGVSAESVKDVFFTPRSITHLADEYSSGVFLHAQMVSQLLRLALDGHKLLKTANDWIEGLWLFVWAVLGGVVGLKGRSPTHFVLVVAMGLLVLAATSYVCFRAALWISVTGPALAWFFSAALLTAYKVKKERQLRAVLMNLFSRHVSPEIADEIWQHRDQFLIDGRPQANNLTATVMFTDVQGFTALSEKLDSQGLMNWVNAYLDEMAPIVASHGGVVNKFIGDAIMAVFGVPVAHTSKIAISSDAVNAVRCALAMEKKLMQLNKRWEEQGLSPIGMRIGIYTGPMVAGSIGNIERLEYTVYGDTVNVASRLENVDKDNFTPDFPHRPCRVLIGDTTLRHLNGTFRVEEKGVITLRGKQTKMHLYRVLSENDSKHG